MQLDWVRGFHKSAYEKQQAQRWTIIASLCLAVAMALTLGVMTWGFYNDLAQMRLTLLQSEISRVRSHAIRTVAVVQDELLQAEARNPGSQNPTDGLSNNPFLRKHWKRTLMTDPSRVYSAIVGLSGRIVAHSDPAQEGQQIEATWYDRAVMEAGDDVVETQVPTLTKGRRAYVVHVPISFGEQVVASYHSSLSVDWLEQSLQEKSQSARWKWAWLFMLIVAVEFGAGFSLFYISRRIAVLNESVKLSRSRRFAEMGQLMAGMVHEIRNPLNAMRLNLHVLNRSRERYAQPFESKDDRVREVDDELLIRETNGEIQRVEGLLRVLLGYARPDIPRNEDLDVRQEIEATLAFLKVLMERAEILVRACFPEIPPHIQMDRDRFRQIMLNLLVNSREAMDLGGTIDIRVTEVSSMVEITVADDGPGIPAAARERVFDPFYSTKETGTGLGLAIVRRYVEEAGGDISVQSQELRGTVFVLRLPVAIPVTNEDISHRLSSS